MAITALGRVREWQRALEFLDEMRRLGLEPTVVSYNAAISACAKGRAVASGRSTSWTRCVKTSSSPT